jgi:hypothetical protein
MLTRRNPLRRAALLLALLALAAIVTGVAASAASQMVVRTLPDGTKAYFPRGAGAEVAKARKIVSFRAPNRNWMYVWRVPLAIGGHCLITNGAMGIQVPPGICFIPRLYKYSSALHAGLEPLGTRFDFFALVRPVVATLELRYQDGKRDRLKPLDGFVLHEITPAHWKRGARLVAAVALNRNGKAISTQTQPFESQAQATHVYP